MTEKVPMRSYEVVVRVPVSFSAGRGHRPHRRAQAFARVLRLAALAAISPRLGPGSRIVKVELREVVRPETTNEAGSPHVASYSPVPAGVSHGE